MVEEIATTEFKASVIEAGAPVLVDFYADWCGPCQAQAPTLDHIATSFDDRAKIAKVNVDRSPELARLFGVRSIPTLILFSGGKIVKRFTGFTEGRDLAAAIERELRN
jgi:thioredoxin 1